jgi:predicted RNase H-like HicB family nuclease
MSRYLIIVEETPSGYSAYSPDLPSCVAADSTRSEFAREMGNAIEFQLEGLRAAYEQVPKSRSEASYFGVAV